MAVRKPAKPRADKKEHVRAAQILMARQDLAAFIAYVIRDENGERVKPAPHQVSWRDHLRYCWTTDKAACILAPMSFAKTITMAIALPLWLLGQNENFRIILVSSAEEVAKKRLQDIQRYVLDSKEYRQVFPWIKPDYTRPWTQEYFNIQRKSASGGHIGSLDHSVSAYGYTAKAGDGSRADVVIFDDVATLENSSSQAERKTLFDKVTTVWITRIPPNHAVKDRNGKIITRNGVKVMIGTRYHEEDIYQSLPMSAQKAWCTYIQAVSEDYTHLDAKIIGACKFPVHPVFEKYQEWFPVYENDMSATNA